MIAAAALILAVGGVAVAWLITHAPAPAPPSSDPESLLDALAREKVIVTLKSGASFSGVLYALDAQAFVLRNTQALGAGARGEHLPVDGELLFFLSDVEYLQRP